MCSSCNWEKLKIVDKEILTLHWKKQDPLTSETGENVLFHFFFSEIPQFEKNKLLCKCTKGSLRILTGKTYPQMKLKRSQKLWLYTIGLLVH